MKKNNKENKKIYVEKKSLIMYMCNIAIIGVLVGVMIKVPSALVIIFSALAISAIILITFATFYEFRDDYLYIRNGFLSSKIYYYKIKEIGDCKKILKLDDKWTRDKIYINHGNNFLIGTSYLAPKNIEEFKEKLNKKIEENKGENIDDKKIRKNGHNNQKHK